MRATSRVIVRVSEHLRSEMTSHRDRSCVGSTFAAAFLTLVVYPATVVAIGSGSNGGLPGLAVLGLAAVLAWRAFGKNHERPWLRRLVQLPLAALTSYSLIAEATFQWLV